MLDRDPIVCSRVDLERHSGSKEQVRQSGLKCQLTCSRGRAKMVGSFVNRKSLRVSPKRCRSTVLRFASDGEAERKPPAGGNQTAALLDERNDWGSRRDKHRV